MSQLTIEMKIRFMIEGYGWDRIRGWRVCFAWSTVGFGYYGNKHLKQGVLGMDVGSTRGCNVEHFPIWGDLYRRLAFAILLSFFNTRSEYSTWVKNIIFRTNGVGLRTTFWYVKRRDC